MAAANLATVGPPTGSNATRAPLPPVSFTSATRSCSSVAMTWAAPSLVSSSRLLPLRVRAMDRAPTMLAI